MLVNFGGLSLAERKAQALVEIDALAEAARLRYITDGAGQAQEYRKTEEQARAYKAAGYPTPFTNTYATVTYPMVYAEMLAQVDAGVLTMNTQAEIDSAAAIATNQIIADADAWLTAANIIKRRRRAAKLKITNATTFGQIRTALNIAWPDPSDGYALAGLGSIGVSGFGGTATGA